MVEQTTEPQAEQKTPEPPRKTERPTRPIQLNSENSRRVRITRAIMRVIGDVCLMKTTCKVTVNHLERVPRTGPTMVLYNHMTYLDPVMSCAPIRFRDNVPIGKSEIHSSPFTGWITWMWQTIPLRRDELDMTALRRALFVLQESNDILSIAPEGHRNQALAKPKEGFVMLAARAGAMIVPVGLSGCQHFRRNMLRLRRTPVSVTYGQPVRLKGKVRRPEYAAAADEIMYQIAAVLPPALRGVYSDLSQASMEYIEYA